MKLTRLAMLLFCLLACNSSAFPQKQKIAPLSIGDKVPEIRFANVLNHKTKSLNLSDLKGKLVILDMWSISCATCIARFPKMDALQKEFNGKIQILLVNPHPANYDSKERIEKTLQKLKERTGFYPSLPIPIHDSILNQYFPHQYVPHVVWIDGKGRLLGVTGSDEVNESNISSILNGDAVNLPVKNDWAFDIAKPLLYEGNGGNAEELLYRSLITGYKEGMGFKSGQRTNNKGDVVGVFMMNKTLYGLIQRAYSQEMNVCPFSRIILDVVDSLKFRPERNAVNTFCYDLVLPPIKASDFQSRQVAEYLQEDLKRYFNVRVYKSKRKLSSFVIKSTNSLQNLFSNNKEESDLDGRTIKKYMHGYNIGQVLNTLLSAQNKPYIDETGISNQKIDIDFPDNFDLTNQQALIDFLKTLGFQIKQEERELEVVVITDK